MKDRWQFNLNLLLYFPFSKFKFSRICLYHVSEVFWYEQCAIFWFYTLNSNIFTKLLQKNLHFYFLNVIEITKVMLHSLWCDIDIEDTLHTSICLLWDNYSHREFFIHHKIYFHSILILILIISDCRFLSL